MVCVLVSSSNHFKYLAAGYYDDYDLLRSVGVNHNYHNPDSYRDL
jgi:hypothetical protein